MNAEFPENSQIGMLEPTQVGHSHALGGPESREHPLRILFVHRRVADVERCLYEFKRVGFAVTSELVVSPASFLGPLRLTSFDLVLAEYPSSNWAGALVLDSLQQIKN